MTATCGQCEGAYEATPDGRRRHQMLNGHAVCRAAAVVEKAPRVVESRTCLRGDHNLCGGGLLWDGAPIACACSCHADDWERAS